jgi:hypothetical protein
MSTLASDSRYEARSALGRALLVFALLVPAACTTVDPAAVTDAFAADGVHVRHVRLRIAPAQTGDFEALLARCVGIAEAAKLSDDHDWLAYRESPGRYWLVTFSDERDGFSIPTSDRALRTFALHLAAIESEDAVAEMEQRLGALEYELEWSILTRQKREWSTVEDMSTSSHPKARMMMRTVRSGEEAAFERALAERTAFLLAKGYPLPVEGFVTLTGLPGTAMQVVFPRDWTSFHAAESFWQFAQRLPEADHDEYTRLKEALMPTMASAEYLDAEHLPAASYTSQ